MKLVVLVRVYNKYIIQAAPKTAGKITTQVPVGPSTRLGTTYTVNVQTKNLEIWSLCQTSST